MARNALYGVLADDVPPWWGIVRVMLLAVVWVFVCIARPARAGSRWEDGAR